jgi:hypothetical protein
VNGKTVPSSCECCIVDVAVIGEEEVFVAFMANSNFVRDLYLARSSDGGASFGDPVQLSEGHWYEPSCPTSGPRLRVGPSGDLHLVWVDAHDFAPQPSAYYARTTNGGATFVDRRALNVENDFVTGHPNFVVTEENVVHVAWERYNPATSAFNLDYATSTDGGATFTPRCAVAGGSATSQWNPSVAVAPGEEILTLAWHEARESTFDLYAASILTAAGVPGGEAPPAATGVLHAWPNPFTHSLALDVAAGGGLFAIYDAQGRLVRELRAAGAPVRWDGRDIRGQDVPAGTYFIQTSDGGSDASAPVKVTRIR